MSRGRGANELQLRRSWVWTVDAEARRLSAFRQILTKETEASAS